MATQLPDFIEPLRLADQGGHISGEIELRAMRRLVQSLNDTQGTVAIDLEFRRDDRGIRYVIGSFAASLVVVCQRCLKPMTLALSRAIRLELTTAVDAPGRLDGDFEVLSVQEQPQSLVDLVEDEVLLALPLAPTHPVGECRASQDAERLHERPAGNPFAVLAKLKGPSKG